MPTLAIPIGPLQNMLQNTIYALPSKRVLLFTDATTPTIQQSSDVGFGTNVAVTLVGGQAELAGGFIRCTSGNINVYLKA